MSLILSGRSEQTSSTVGQSIDDPISDEALVRRLVGGDCRAYEMLMRRHRGLIYRVALRMLGNPCDAEDIAQEVMLRMPTAAQSYRGTSSFSTWLYRVVVNQCHGQLRRSRRSCPTPRHDDSVSPGADVTILSRQRSAAVLAAVAALEPTLRTAIVLCEFEGLTYREAAAILAVPEPTVRGRLYRARRTLLSALWQWR